MHGRHRKEGRSLELPERSTPLAVHTVQILCTCSTSFESAHWSSEADLSTQATKEGRRREFNQREAHRTCWKRAPWSNTPPNPDPPVWPAQVLLNTPVSCPSFSPILWLKENLECKYILGLSDPNLQHLVLCCAHSREFAKIQGCKHRTTRGILVN